MRFIVGQYDLHICSWTAMPFCTPKAVPRDDLVYDVNVPGHYVMDEHGRRLPNTRRLGSKKHSDRLI
jgi:hypothetical protein